LDARSLFRLIGDTNEIASLVSPRRDALAGLERFFRNQTSEAECLEGSMIEKPQQDDYRNRNTKQPEKHTTAQNTAPLIASPLIASPLIARQYRPRFGGQRPNPTISGTPTWRWVCFRDGGLISQLADAIVICFHAFVLPSDDSAPSSHLSAAFSNTFFS
jgi:hypothetical protein